MTHLDIFFSLSLLVQLAHSIEEISTGFHERWYLARISFRSFLTFEIGFSIFWILVWLLPSFPQREVLQVFFLVLMFANGIQHLAWWGQEKKYVPGLITAHLHVIVFLVFYFKAILP